MDDQLTQSTYVVDANAPEEQVRLLHQGILLTEALGGLLPFPVADNLHAPSVLDVGCGPGAWALEFAFQHPEWNITGIDISEGMLAYAQAQAFARDLKQTQFYHMSATNVPLDFEENDFDLVYARYICAFMTRAIWPQFLKEAFRLLKPGGTICLVEGEMPWITSPAMDTLFSLLERSPGFQRLSFSTSGRGYAIAPILPKMMRQSGFEKVQTQAAYVDTSFQVSEREGWRRDGEIFIAQLRQPLIAQKMITEEEFESLSQRALREQSSPDFEAGNFVISCWGAKPL